MAKERSLLVRILGDASKAEKAFKNVDQAAERSQGVLGRAGGFMQNTLDKVGLGGSRASRALEGVGLAAGSTVTPAAAAAAGVGAVVAVATKGVNEFVGLAAKVRDFQRASGASAEESSRFVAVLDDFGIAADTGAGAIFKLGKGAEANEAKLNALGVQLARNADGTINLTETTLNVADAYAQTADPAKRAEIATAAFGKQGQALIPVLEQGRKGLKEFFKGAEEGRQIFSQEDLDQAREFELAIDALGDATGGLFREMGSLVVGPLTNLVTTLAELTEAGADFANSDFVQTVWDDLHLAFGTDERILKELTKETEANRQKTEENAAAKADLQEATEDLTAAQKDAAAAAKEEEKALDSLLRAQLGMIDADIRLENSQRAVREAREAHDVAIAAAHAAKGKDVELNRENEKATQALKQAIVDEAQAQVALTKQKLEATGQTLSQAQANDIFRARLLEVAKTLEPGNALRSELEGYAAQLQSLPEAKKTLITVELDTAPAEASFRAMEREFTNRERTEETPRRRPVGVQRRAHGGPVRAGEPYLVGEEGMEVFVPASSGEVVPNRGGAAAAALASGSTFAEGAIKINVNGEGLDEDAMAQLLTQRLGWELAKRA